MGCWIGWLGLAGLGCVGALGGFARAAGEGPEAGGAARGLVVTEIDQAEVVNRRPRFHTLAPLTAREGRPYRYGFKAEDPAGDEVTYSLVQAPEGASLRGRTLTWVPGPAQAGRPQEFTLRAADAHGLVSEQHWQVLPGSRSAPRFLGKAPAHWPREGGYVYHVRMGSGPGRGRLRLALEKAPAGAALKGSGRHWRVTWDPPGGRPAAPELFILRAIDGTGAVALQVWTVGGP